MEGATYSHRRGNLLPPLEHPLHLPWLPSSWWRDTIFNDMQGHANKRPFGQPRSQQYKHRSASKDPTRGQRIETHCQRRFEVPWLFPALCSSVPFWIMSSTCQAMQVAASMFACVAFAMWSNASLSICFLWTNMDFPPHLVPGTKPSSTTCWLTRRILR